MRGALFTPPLPPPTPAFYQPWAAHAFPSWKPRQRKEVGSRKGVTFWHYESTFGLLWTCCKSKIKSLWGWQTFRLDSLQTVSLLGSFTSVLTTEATLHLLVPVKSPICMIYATQTLPFEDISLFLLQVISEHLWVDFVSYCPTSAHQAVITHPFAKGSFWQTESSGFPNTAASPLLWTQLTSYNLITVGLSTLGPGPTEDSGQLVCMVSSKQFSLNVGWVCTEWGCPSLGAAIAFLPTFSNCYLIILLKVGVDSRAT